MKRAIILLGFFLSLLGSTVFPAHVGTPAYAASEEPKEGVKLPEFEYYQMSPMTFPIITDQGVTQQVSLVVSLELPYGKKEELKQFEPRLADAYLQDLYGALGSGHGLIVGGVVDVQAVKKRLTEVTYKVVTPELVKAVLLQVLQQRRAL